MLSEDQLRSYHENGIVVPDYQFPTDLLEGIKADHARLTARHPEFTDMCPTVLAYDLCFLNYVRAPGLIDMVGQILGPDFALWNSSFFAGLSKSGSPAYAGIGPSLVGKARTSQWFPRVCGDRPNCRVDR